MSSCRAYIAKLKRWGCSGEGTPGVSYSGKNRCTCRTFTKSIVVCGNADVVRLLGSSLADFAILLRS